MRSSHRGIVAVLVVAGGVCAATSAAAPAAPRCGAPGLPPCPLQRFMREQVAAPRARGDLAGVATGLETLARLRPADRRFGKWPELCQQGAAAARAGRPRGALLACVKCHDALRPEYDRSYRERALAR